MRHNAKSCIREYMIATNTASYGTFLLLDSASRHRCCDILQQDKKGMLVCTLLVLLTASHNERCLAHYETEVTTHIQIYREIDRYGLPRTHLMILMWHMCALAQQMRATSPVSYLYICVIQNRLAVLSICTCCSHYKSWRTVLSVSHRRQKKANRLPRAHLRKLDCWESWFQLAMYMGISCTTRDSRVYCLFEGHNLLADIEEAKQPRSTSLGSTKRCRKMTQNTKVSYTRLSARQVVNWCLHTKIGLV